MLNSVVAFVMAFLFAALPGKFVIERLRQLKATQNISADAPTSHSKKAGTPTMGGLLILFALTATTLPYFLLTQFGPLRHGPFDPSPFVVLILTLAFAAIGIADDYMSLKRGKNLGLTAKQKFAAQCVFAILFLVWVGMHATVKTTQIHLLPQELTNAFGIDPQVRSLGWLYYPLALLYLVGFSNATNITDGLDGLVSGVVISICLAMALLIGATYPDLSYFCVALAGGLAGFLWWNAHPAKVFMGDTASLALGAGLVAVSMLSKQEVGLIVASLVCWAELISVMIQVSVFKYRKRKHGIDYARANRVFRRTPLHHHFEEGGIEETRVVQRFWIASAICAALALLWNQG